MASQAASTGTTYPASVPAAGFERRMIGYLPKGNALPHAAWATRHRVILCLVWAQALALGVYGLYQGFGVEHSIFEGTAVLSVPLLTELLRITNRTVRSTAASAGLITASAVLTHL